MEQQLELFAALPLALRPQRRLRLLGFELDLLERDAAKLADLRRKTDQGAAQLAAVVAAAKLFGHVPRDAYEVVVMIDDTREEIASKLRDTDALHRAIEQKLATAIERHVLDREGNTLPAPA